MWHVRYRISAGSYTNPRLVTGLINLLLCSRPKVKILFGYLIAFRYVFLTKHRHYVILDSSNLDTFDCKKHNIEPRITHYQPSQDWEHCHVIDTCLLSSRSIHSHLIPAMHAIFPRLHVSRRIPRPSATIAIPKKYLPGQSLLARSPSSIHPSAQAPSAAWRLPRAGSRPPSCRLPCEIISLSPPPRNPQYMRDECVSYICLPP